MRCVPAVDGQIGETDRIAGGGIGKGRSVEAGDPHLVADVVHACLPADEVLHVLDDEVDGVAVGVAPRRRRGQAVVDRTHGHVVSSRVLNPIGERVGTGRELLPLVSMSRATEVSWTVRELSARERMATQHYDCGGDPLGIARSVPCDILSSARIRRAESMETTMA